MRSRGVTIPTTGGTVQPEQPAAPGGNGKVPTTGYGQTGYDYSQQQQYGQTGYDASGKGGGAAGVYDAVNYGTDTAEAEALARARAAGDINTSQSYTPWIVGGVVLAAAGALTLAYFLTRER